MRALVQRVKSAKVTVGEHFSNEINHGLLLFLGVGNADTEKEIDFVVEKISNLRIFSDEDGKMNKSLLDVKGEILLVSQFTLFADVAKGRRPSFISAAEPQKAVELYKKCIQKFQEMGISTKQGEFGAHMQVQLINDGPVTIWIDTDNL